MRGSGAEIVASEVIPVRIDSLSPGVAKNIDIFVLRNKRPVLYKRAGIPISVDHLSDLKGSGVEFVYIKKTDCQAFIKDLDEKIVEIFSGEISVEKVKEWVERIEQISEAVLQAPSKENLQAAKRVTKKFSALLEKKPRIAYFTAFALKKDITTAIHISNVHALASSFAYHLGLRDKELELVVTGSFFHDIGKIRVPDKILKKPGKLTLTEYEVVKKHTIWGREILRNSDLEEYAEVAFYHHEFLDGSGYPEGLIGNQIPLSAKIVQICDIYEALTGMRPYRDPKEPFDALTLVLEEFVNEEKIDKTLYKEFIIYLHANRI